MQDQTQLENHGDIAVIEGRSSLRTTTYPMMNTTTPQSLQGGFMLMWRMIQVCTDIQESILDMSVLQSLTTSSMATTSTSRRRRPHTHPTHLTQATSLCVALQTCLCRPNACIAPPLFAPI